MTRFRGDLLAADHHIDSVRRREPGGGVLLRALISALISASLIVGYITGAAGPAAAVDVGVQPYAYWVQASGNADLFNCGVGSNTLQYAYGNVRVAGSSMRKYGPSCSLTRFSYDQSNALVMQPVYYNQGTQYACPLPAASSTDSSGSDTYFVSLFYMNYPDWSGTASACRNGYGAYMHGYTFQVITLHKVQVSADGWQSHSAILASGGLNL